MNFDFVDVFIRAAKITWRYKVLWIFGILAGCARGNSGGGSNSNFNPNTGYQGNGFSDSPFTPEMIRQMESFAEKAVNWFEHNSWILFVLVAFALLSIIIQIFFYFIGTAGLVRGVTQVEDGAQSLHFGELLSESLKYFWRLFGAALILWIPFYTVFFLILFGVLTFGIFPVIDDPASAGVGMMGSVILMFISICCCFFPVTIVVSLYNQMVNRAIIVENEGVLTALSRGWMVFSKNIGALLIVAVLLFVIGLVGGLIISIPIFIPTVLVVQSMLQGGFTSWQPIINLFIFMLCYTPVLWFLYGILTTYTESVWTLSYLQFTRPHPSQIVFADTAPDVQAK